MDSGDYHCEITNSTLQDLTIIRAPITVVVDSNLNVEDFDDDNGINLPNPNQKLVKH